MAKIVMSVLEYRLRELEVRDNLNGIRFAFDRINAMLNKSMGKFSINGFQLDDWSGSNSLYESLLDHHRNVRAGNKSPLCIVGSFQYTTPFVQEPFGVLRLSGINFAFDGYPDFSICGIYALNQDLQFYLCGVRDVQKNPKAKELVKLA